MNPENKKARMRSMTLIFVSLFLCFVAFFVAVWVFTDSTVSEINTEQIDISQENQTKLIETTQKTSKATENSPKTLKISGQVIEIDIADTSEERSLGLSGRPGLGENQGLLFIFENPAIYGFWMKDMLFPIDMIWIDEQKKIVHIEKDVMPKSYPKVFESSLPAKYVLEVRAGFTNEKGIMLGDSVAF